MPMVQKKKVGKHVSSISKLYRSEENKIIASNSTSFRKWMQDHMRWMLLNKQQFRFPKNNLRNKIFNDEGNSL